MTAGHPENDQDVFLQFVYIGYTLFSRHQQLAHYHNERGYTEYFQVEFPAAKKDYTKALQYDSKLAVALYNRWLVHYRLGRYDTAIQDMKDTLVLDPTFQSAQQCIDQVIIDKRNKTEGIKEPK